MAFCPIDFGNWSFEYFYILGTFLSRLLEDYIISLDDIRDDIKKNIIGIETVFRKNKLIRIFYKNLGYIFFGIILFYREVKNNNKTNQLNTNNNTKSLNIALIYNRFIFIRKTLKELLIIGSFYSFQNIIRRILQFFKLNSLDLWIFNIIFILLFMNHFFVVNIYKHQKFSLIFIFSTNFILLISSTFVKNLSSLENKNESLNSYKHIEEVFGNLSYFILIYIIYLILSCLLSFSRVYSKYLMDIKYESLYKIIFFIGAIGSSLSIITLIFTSIFNCNEKIISYCKIYKNKKDKHYLDSIPIYFFNLKNKFNEKASHFFLELFIVYPLFLVITFIQLLFEMKIILTLNPNFILISDCLYFGIKELLNCIFEKKFNSVNFYINIIAEICAFLGYIIFLEIIELKFCDLNKDLKKNIIERGIIESKMKDIDINFEKIDSEEDNDGNSSDNEDEQEETLK